MGWKLTGSYFESCNCEVACPCVFLGPPTTGECTAIVGWHIDEGTFEGASLGGLNVAMAVHAPGHMAEGKWRAALYLDETCSPDQETALGKIFSGAAGGHPAVLGSFIGEVLGVTKAALEFGSDGSSRSLRIGSVGDAKVTAIEGQGGAQVSIQNHPLAVAPGQVLVSARSDRMRYDDHGYDWDITAKSGFFSPFEYQG